MADERAERAERARKTAYALSVWDQAVPATGTAAETYLALRGLLLPDSVEARFHPKCPRAGGHCPALVVLMRLIEGDTAVAVQRIFIDKTYRKDGRGMMLGPTRGAAMKLTSHRACCTGGGQSWFMPRLHVCEGFETGLALLQLGHAPVWALGSAGAIERLPELFFVGELIVAIDHDASKAGQAAYEEVKLRWHAAGRRVSGITTNPVGSDFADLVQQQMEDERL